MKGFQGWRYFEARGIKVVGNWLDPKTFNKGGRCGQEGLENQRAAQEKTRPVRLRYRDSSGKIYQGNFVWSDGENTWVECAEEGVGLYEDDGWKVLGWK